MLTAIMLVNYTLYRMEFDTRMSSESCNGRMWQWGKVHRRLLSDIKKNMSPSLSTMSWRRGRPVKFHALFSWALSR